LRSCSGSQALDRNSYGRGKYATSQHRLFVTSRVPLGSGPGVGLMAYGAKSSDN